MAESDRHDTGVLGGLATEWWKPGVTRLSDVDVEDRRRPFSLEIDSSSARYRTPRITAGTILISTSISLVSCFIPLSSLSPVPLSPFQQAAESDVAIAVDKCASGQGARLCDSLGFMKIAEKRGLNSL